MRECGELQWAKAVESKNKDRISKLIADAEAYLKEHFDKEYYVPVKEAAHWEKPCEREISKKSRRTEERASADSFQTFRTSGNKG